MNSEIIERLLYSRSRLMDMLQPSTADRKLEEEGGCGVVGLLHGTGSGTAYL